VELVEVGWWFRPEKQAQLLVQASPVDQEENMEKMGPKGGQQRPWTLP